MDCHALRDAWIADLQQEVRALVGRRGAVDRVRFREGGTSPEVEAHLASCGACSSFRKRLRAQARALAYLARYLEVPAELDGRVVATLHAGHRQDRAARAVETLADRRAPAELEHAVEALLERPFDLKGQLAPSVLDRLVEEDLRDPQKALAVRMLGVLRRKRAPALLGRRLAASLRSRGPGARKPRSSAAVGALVGLACAASLAVWLGLRGAGDGALGPGGGAVESGYDFELVELDPAQPDAKLRLARLAAQIPQLMGATVPDRPRNVPGSDLPGNGSSVAVSRAERSPVSAPNAQGVQSPSDATLSSEVLERMVGAPFRVGYRGIRTVFLGYGGAPLEYREEVGADGEGFFSVDALELLSWHPNPDVFLNRLDRRAGFHYRYRDFGIEDLLLFQSNYTVTYQGLAPNVAGQECVRLLVEKTTDPTGSRYEVDVDVVSGLILRWRERDANDVLLAEVEFESFTRGADVSDMPLPEGSSEEVPVEGFEFPVLQPVELPAGYRFLHAARLVDPLGDVWIRLTYGDGLEQMSLLHQAPVDQGNAHSGRIVAIPYGPWRVLDGTVDGYRVILAGKTGVDDLAQMLQSAIE